jgi:hypothetical protein
MGYMITELGIKTGKYPKEFDDMQDHVDMQEMFLNVATEEEPDKVGDPLGGKKEPDKVEQLNIIQAREVAQPGDIGYGGAYGHDISGNAK